MERNLLLPQSCYLTAYITHVWHKTLSPTGHKQCPQLKESLLSLVWKMLSGSRCGQVIELETARVFKKKKKTQLSMQTRYLWSLSSESAFLKYPDVSFYIRRKDMLHAVTLLPNSAHVWPSYPWETLDAHAPLQIYSSLRTEARLKVFQEDCPVCLLHCLWRLDSAREITQDEW